MAWEKSLHSRLHESTAPQPKQHLDHCGFCSTMRCSDAKGRCVNACDCASTRRTPRSSCGCCGEIFQLVARQFCQEEAVQRINALLPAFFGWLSERMLTRVQAS